MKNLYTVEDGVREVFEMLKNGIITDPYKDYYYNTLPDLGVKDSDNKKTNVEKIE